MQINHPSEVALQQAIATRASAKTILGQIKNIEEYEGNNPPSLDKTTAENQTFLYLAVLNQCQNEVIEKLFNYLRNEPELLFATTNEDKTVFWEACRFGNVSLVTQLLDIAKKQTVNQPGYKIWLKSDNNGVTAYQIAAANHHKNILEILLIEIEKEIESLAVINHSDIGKGDTALHHTFRVLQSVDDEVTASDLLTTAKNLLKSGADLSIENFNGESPMTYFAQFSINLQTIIYDMLDESNKDNLLTSFWHYLANSQPESTDEIKNKYITLCGLKNLQTMIIAVLEFRIKDEKHMRETYQSTIKGYDKENKPTIVYTQATIPDDILNRMPLYAIRLQKIKTKIDILIDESDSVDTSLPFYRKLNRDQLILKQTLQLLKNYELVLQQINPPASKWRVGLKATLGTLGLGTSNGIFGFLTYILWANSGSTPVWGNALFNLLYGGMDFLFCFLTISGVRRIQNGEGKLSRDDQQIINIIAALQKDILSPLNELEKKEQIDQLLNLTQELNYLDKKQKQTLESLKEQLKHNQYKGDLSNIINQLVTLIENMLNDAVFNYKPFSFYEANKQNISTRIVREQQLRDHDDENDTELDTLKKVLTQ